MVADIQQFAVTIPANTPKSANFSQKLTMPARIVRQIDWVVPPGPRGEVGWALGGNGFAALPSTPGAFIVTDDQKDSWVVENQIDNGAWQCFGYNTGQFPHTIYFTFLCDTISTVPAVATTGPIPGGTLGGAGDQTGGGPGTGDQGGGTDGLPPPPVVPPPVLTPPSAGGLPLMLPPTLPTFPGSPAPSLPLDFEPILVGVADAAQVWLLSEGNYTQLQDQDTVDGMVAAGVPTWNVTTAQHHALFVSSHAVLTISLGTSRIHRSLNISRR